MIELEPPNVEVDVNTTAIEYNLSLLAPHRPKDVRVFYVVFTRPFRIYTRPFEETQKQGFDAVFFQPKVDLPSNYAWDCIMYSSETGEAIARQKNRPS